MREPRYRTLKRWRFENKDILPVSKSSNSTFGSSGWLDECGQKVAHFSKESALQHIIEISRKPLIHNTYDRKLTIYLCSWCDWFHVGHECQKGKDNVIYTHWC